MFSFLRHRRIHKLVKAHRALLERARDVQRSGDLKQYAAMMDEAARLERQIEAARLEVEGSSA